MSILPRTERSLGKLFLRMGAFPQGTYLAAWAGKENCRSNVRREGCGPKGRTKEAGDR